MNKNGIIKVAEGTENVSLKEFDYGETGRFYFPKSLKSISMIGKNIKKEIGACAFPFETGRIYVPKNVDKIEVYSEVGESYFVTRGKQENIYGIETVWEGSAEAEMKIIKVSDKRQITIPKEFFEKLGIGDEAVCEMTDCGIIIRPLDGVAAKMRDSKKTAA